MKKTSKSQFDIDTGKALAKYRKNSKLTQMDVSKRMNKSRQWVSDVENGVLSITWNDIKELCIIYGISTEDISREVDK